MKRLTVFSATAVALAALAAGVPVRAGGEPIAELRRVVGELREFAATLERTSPPADDVLPELWRFHRGLPELRQRADRAVRDLRRILGDAGRPHRSRKLAAYFQLPPRRVAPGRVSSPVFVRSDPVVAPAALPEARRRRALALASAIIAGARERERESALARAVRFRPARPRAGALALDLERVARRLDAVFVTLEGALPRVLRALEEERPFLEGRRLREALGTLGGTPGELARTLERIQRSLLEILRSQVDLLEATSPGDPDRPDRNDIPGEESPHRNRRTP